MKRKILLLTATILLQTQIYSQLKNYNDKGNVNVIAESTVITITELSTNLKPERQMAGLIAASGEVLPPVIDLVIKTVQQKAKKNALAYTGQYKNVVSGDNFYKSNLEVSLPKLTLTRTIRTTSGIIVAVELDLIPEISDDKTAFRYYIKDKCIYNYSIAKTKGDYDYVDLDIEIRFKSLFVNKEAYRFEELRTTSINVPMIHVGNTKQLEEKIYSGWIPLPTRSDVKKDPDIIREEKSVERTLNNGTIEKTIEITLTKKSNNDNFEKISDYTGLYEIAVTVTETNLYKIKAENRNEIIEGSSESGTNFLNAMLKTFLKDDDSK